MDEQVDILTPPTFERSGQVKSLKQAWEDEDWIGTFNLWVIQSDPTPAIVYQQRSPNSSWGPNLLDITAGGHYKAGEEGLDGLREVQEELGKDYPKDQIVYLGRKINISPDVSNHMRNNILNIYMVLDNSPLEGYTLEESEVYAILSCPIKDLLRVHRDPNYTFEAEGLTAQKKPIKIKVTKKSFPYNWDNYHYKIALLAQRFLNKEEGLIY